MRYFNNLDPLADEDPWFQPRLRSDDAIAALSGAARKESTLSPDDVARSTAALVRAGQPAAPQEAPPEPTDPAAERAAAALTTMGSERDAARQAAEAEAKAAEPDPQAKAIAALAARDNSLAALTRRAQELSQAKSAEEAAAAAKATAPDPELAARAKANSYGALKAEQDRLEAEKPKPAPSEPPPDPEIARVARAVSLGRLGKEAVRTAAPPPRAEPRVPFSGIPERPGARDEAERQLKTATIDPERSLTPEAFEASARKYATSGPDMHISLADADRASGVDSTAAERRATLAAPTPPDETDHANGVKPVAAVTVNKETVQEPGKPSVTETTVDAGDDVPHASMGLELRKPKLIRDQPTGDKESPVTGQTSASDQTGEVEQVVARAKAREADHASQNNSDDDGPPKLNQWALALDAVANGGRGVQQIVAMHDQQVKSWKAKRDDALGDEYKRAQIEHLNKTGKAASDWEADKSARDWENIRLRDKGLGQSGEKVELARDKFGQLIDPDSAFTTTKVSTAGRVADASTRAREGVKHELNTQKGDDAADLAGKVSTARTQAALPAQKEMKATPTPTEQRTQEEKNLLSSPIPGVEVTNPEAWSAAHTNAAARQKTEDYVSGVNQSIKGLDRMIEIREKVGARALPDKEAYEMRNLQKAVIGGEAKAGNTGVLNGAEFPRYAGDVPDGSLGWSDAGDFVLDATGNKRDTVLEKLKGARDAAAHALDVGLATRGARAAGATDGIAQTAPGSEDVPGNLGTTSGVPKIPAEDPLEKWRKRGVLK